MCMPTPTNVSGLGYSWGFTSTSDISKAELDGTNNLNYTLGNTISNTDTLTVASHKSPHAQEKVVKGTTKRTMFLVNNDNFTHNNTHRNNQPNHTTIQGFSTQNLTGKHFMTPLGPIQLTAEECNEILMKRALQAAQGLQGGAVLDAATVQLNHGIINGNIKGMGNDGSGSMSPESQSHNQQHNNTIQQLQLVQAKQEPGTNIHSPKNVSIIQEVPSSSSLVMYRAGSISPLDHNERSLNSTPGMPKERPFSCDECGKSFLLKHHLTTHSRVHTGERPHACPHCGKAFAHKHCLNTHLLLHSSERPFQCQECKKSFTLKHHLLTHSRVHSRERPFMCTECGRGFPLKRHLVTHSKYHAGERPFVCQDCGESFAQKDHLVMHSRFHGSLNPFVCSDCGAAFTRKFQLVNHGRVHGRVPHSCVICGKEFLQKRTLVAHMKLHTGDSQYACVDCGEAFKNKMDLIQHCKIMHPPNITTTVSVGQQTSSTSVSQQQQNQQQQQQQVDMKPQIVQVVGHADKQKPTVFQLIGDGGLHEKASPAYSCQECGNCFNTKEALALHVRLHTGDKTFVTDLCTLTAALQPGNFLNPTPGQQGSTQSLQILHGGVLQHTNTANIVSVGNSVGSNAVGTTTISSSNASGNNSGGVLVGVGSAGSTVHHVVHAQPRPKAHFCPDCGKGFASRHGLSQHQRRHPDGGCTMRSHVCDNCGKAFFQKNHLLLHQRQHMDLPPRGSQQSMATTIYIEKQQQQDINQQQNGQQQQLGGDSSRQSDATNHSSSSNSSLQQQQSGPTHIQVTNRDGQVIGNQILIGGPRNRQIIGNQIHIVNREGKTIGTQITSPGTSLVTIKQEHIQNNRDASQQQLSNNHQQQRNDTSHQMSSTGHQQQQVVQQQHSEGLTQHREQQQMVTLQQHKEGGTTHLTTSTGHLILRNSSRGEVGNGQQIAQLHQLGGAHVMKFEIIPQSNVVQIQPSID